LLRISEISSACYTTLRSTAPFKGFKPDVWGGAPAFISVDRGLSLRQNGFQALVLGLRWFWPCFLFETRLLGGYGDSGVGIGAAIAVV